MVVNSNNVVIEGVDDAILVDDCSTHGDRRPSLITINAGTTDQKGSVVISSKNSHALNINNNRPADVKTTHVSINSTGTINIDGDISIGSIVGQTILEINAQDFKDANDVTQSAGQATVVIKGNVKTGAGTDGDGDAIKINLTNDKSQLIGAVIDQKPAETGGTQLTLSNGAQWVPTADSNLKSLKADNGVIVVDTNTKDVAISASNVSGSVDIHATPSLNDEINNAAELSEKLSSVITAQSTDDVRVSVSAEEGLITDSFSAAVTDEGAVVITQTKTNTYVQAVSNLIENQTIEFRSQINDVSKRMGDLRTDEGNVGAWVRVYGGKNKYQTSGVSNKYRTLQVGGDTSVRLLSGRLYVGLTGLYKEGDSNLINGTAEDESFGGGFYTGYLADNGWYLDFITKYSFMQNDFSFSYTDGRIGKGKYKTKGLSASFETGCRVTNEYGVFAEPQFELMFGHIKGFDYDTSAGVHAEHDSMKTVIGRMGLSLGKVFDENRGSAYFNVSILNDFDGRQSAVYSVKGRSRHAEVDIGGSWVEAAVGGTYKLGKNFYVYGELATSHGTEVKNPFQWNIGGRLSF